MQQHEFLQVLLFFSLLLGLTPVLGFFMARVFEGQPPMFVRWLTPLEKWIYRLGGVKPDEEMTWRRYFRAVLLFNLVGLFTLWGLQFVQGGLPLNPQKFGYVPWALALNTAVSFITNTNWQAYSGESTLSYLTQMAGLSVHNFLSGATGIAVLVAFARGLRRASAHTLGSFWVDVTRATVYVLLPLAILLAVLLASQGVVQTFSPYVTARTVEGVEQVIPLGPAASQIAIKHLGTNGGGFFGQNSAHPFENPTPLSNFAEMFGLIMLAAALVYTFGLLIGDRRHAWCLFGVMLTLLIAGFAVAFWSESQPNPVFGCAVTALQLGRAGSAALPRDSAASSLAASKDGGSGGPALPAGCPQPLLEGKETRFGVMNSTLFAVATSGTSCGAVNSMHDSFTPLAGLMPMWNLMLGCIVFGGVGAGLYGILMHVLITVFIAGLMVGRTPEYLGKKIQSWEATWAVVAILTPNLLVLLGSAVACSVPDGLAGLGNQGPHGLSEIFYAYASCAANNGSAFAGLNANSLFYNLTLGEAMLLGRFVPIFAVLAIAGSLSAKKTVPASPGTFPTNGLTFALTLLGIIVIVAALTFFPALCLGPIVEHGLMLAGRTF